MVWTVYGQRYYLQINTGFDVNLLFTELKSLHALYRVQILQQQQYHVVWAHLLLSKMELHWPKGKWHGWWRMTWGQPCSIYKARDYALCPLHLPPQYQPPTLGDHIQLQLEQETDRRQPPLVAMEGLPQMDLSVNTHRRTTIERLSQQMEHLLWLLPKHLKVKGSPVMGLKVEPDAICSLSVLVRYPSWHCCDPAK